MVNTIFLKYKVTAYNRSLWSGLSPNPAHSESFSASDLPFFETISFPLVTSDSEREKLVKDLVDDSCTQTTPGIRT